MAAMITIEGIDNVLSSLGYCDGNTLKSRLLVLVRNSYDKNTDASEIENIDRDGLIRSLWGLDSDPETFKNKRRNFSSLKSSVNKDLKDLYESGRNPEGIILGAHNCFALSNEAKDRILENLSNTIKGSGTGSLDKITKIMEVVNELLSDPNVLPDVRGTETQNRLDQLKGILKSLSSTVDAASPSGRILEERHGSDFPAEDSRGSPLDTLGTVESLEPEEVEETEGGEDLEEIEEVDQVQPDEVIEEIVVSTAQDLHEGPEEIQKVEEEPGDVEESEHWAETDAAELIQGVEESDEYALSDGLREGIKAEGEVGEAESGLKEFESLGLPVNSLGEFFSAGEFESGRQIDKARLLAEEFDGYLGAMDRFFNQYLLIPAGRYVSGSKTSGASELSERTVDLDAFYMGRFPVTNALFEIFVEKTGYKTTAEKKGFGTVYEGRYSVVSDPDTGRRSLCWRSAVTVRKVEGACWFQPSGPGSTLHNKRNHPVVQISLRDATAFSAWTGKRLPSEEEWEAAARTSHGHMYPWGNEWGNGRCNTEESREGGTTQVDRYVFCANELGIADALGNVLEWTLRQDCSDPEEKISIRSCVAKGAGWTSASGSCSLCSRLLFEPDFHSNILGFRCVAY